MPLNVKDHILKPLLKKGYIGMMNLSCILKSTTYTSKRLKMKCKIGSPVTDEAVAVLKIEEVYSRQAQLCTHKLTQSVSAMNPADLTDTTD